MVFCRVCRRSARRVAAADQEGPEGVPASQWNSKGRKPDRQSDMQPTDTSWSGGVMNMSAARGSPISDIPCSGRSNALFFSK